MAIVEIESLTYSYPHTDQPALRDLSLRVEEGEFLAIIGANGAGKSTLCYTLTGFVPHFFQGEMEGQVHVAGLETRASSLEDIVLVAGLVFLAPAPAFFAATASSNRCRGAAPAVTACRSPGQLATFRRGSATE